MNQPRLVIGYEGKGIPVTAVCSFCGEYMPQEILGAHSSKETIARFQEQFEIHIQMKHAQNPVN